MHARQLQQLIDEAARRAGWRVFVADPDATGFPNLVLVHAEQGRLVFATLLEDARAPGGAQRGWLDALRRVGGGIGSPFRLWRPTAHIVEVYEWRPSDWQEIHATLGAEQPARSAA